MEIPDISKEEGLTFLDNHLKDKSYIGGYNPSKADTLVWDKLKKCPCDKFENVFRWYKHFATFGAERNSLPPSDVEISFAQAPQTDACCPVDKSAQQAEVNEPVLPFNYCLVLFCRLSFTLFCSVFTLFTRPIHFYNKSHLFSLFSGKSFKAEEGESEEREGWRRRA